MPRQSKEDKMALQKEHLERELNRISFLCDELFISPEVMITFLVRARKFSYIISQLFSNLPNDHLLRDELNKLRKEANKLEL